MARQLSNWWQQWLITADEGKTRARRVFGSTSSPTVPAKSLQVSGLEPRILFSATPIDPAMMPGGDQAAMVAVVETSADELEAASIDSLAEETQTSQSSRELIIIDAQVPDIEQLLDDLSTSGRDAEVFVLDSDRDGVDQITEILESRTEVDSIHIVSHATQGAVKLGNVWLGESHLAGYCLLYTSPSPRDGLLSRMPSSA